MKTNFTILLCLFVNTIFSQTLVSLDLNQLPDLSYNSIPNEVSIEKGETVTLGANLVVSGGTGTYDYYWLPSDLVSNSTIATPTTKPNETTTFYQTVTDGNGCRLFFSYKINVTDPSTIPVQEINSLSLKLNLTPNPASESVKVLVTGEPSDSKVYISIIDNSGKILQLKSLDSFSGSELIPFSFDIPQGIYSVIVECGNSKITEKLIIE